MSGYQEMKGRTHCWEQGLNRVNAGVYDRTMDASYWMPPGSSRCQPSGVTMQCSTYGPNSVPITTRESFLQGRGQVLSSKCPEGGVIYLPKGVFEMGGPITQNQGCQDTTMDPYHERQPKSCFNISETDTTAYTMGIPSAWQGTNATFTDFNGTTYVSDREAGRAQYASHSRGSSAESRGSYGSYK